MRPKCLKKFKFNTLLKPHHPTTQYRATITNRPHRLVPRPPPPRPDLLNPKARKQSCCATGILNVSSHRTNAPNDLPTSNATPCRTSHPPRRQRIPTGVSMVWTNSARSVKTAKPPIWHSPKRKRSKK